MAEAQPQIAPYGAWKSPITSERIVAQTVGLGEIVLEGDQVYWAEMRPSEGGRTVIVRRAPDGTTADITPAGFNARTKVHEYGGGAYTVADGVVYFSNFGDQRLYRQRPGEAPQAITPDVPLRYADGAVDHRRRVMICVREDHRPAGRPPENTLVEIALDGDAQGGRVLVEGNDFYAAPRLSPDGTRLAWLTWNHPNMPWDGTELWVADLRADGTPANARCVAGGADESVFQPEWSPDGVLHFVSDRSNWWNLYRWRAGRIEPLHPMPGEFGVPLWHFGAATYGFISATEICCAHTMDGLWHLSRLDTSSGGFHRVDQPCTAIGGLRAAHGRAVYVGASPTQRSAVIAVRPSTGRLEVLRRASDAPIDPGYLSLPEPVEFPSGHGQTAHAFFYPPHNQDHTAPPGERPPLLVKIHGGPTAAAGTAFNPGIQYWTSRGIAVLDVNYGGSTGFGREYRRRLMGRWGLVDVDDCANGARFLAERGLVDGDRLMITGGSAGGYTTLAALTFRDVFRAGASHFGISDIEVLARDTHKFESRYLDTLVGPYPEARALYHERSPLHHTDRLSRPVIFFQGLEDRVVPPNQAERMVQALREKGLPVAYLAFEGEGHGLRRAENIRRALDAELYFYSQVVGFPLADAVAPVTIENL